MQEIKRSKDTLRRWISLTALLSASILSAGCATTHPYVYNDTDLVPRLVNSDHHTITYVRVYRDHDDMVLHGKVAHHHGDCTSEGVVTLTVTDPRGRPGRSERMPLRAGSPKQHGWYGASFRIRFEPVPAAGSRLLLAIDDSGCPDGQ